MKDLSDIPAMMADLGGRARDAAAELAFVPTAKKVAALEAAAAAIETRSAQITSANQLDVADGRDRGLSEPMLDRLLLDEARIGAIRDGLLEVAAVPDPVGEVMAEWDRPSGLNIRRVRTPLGVVGVIFESRPNVTADAGALCLMAGNAAILRGGSESFNSSGAIHACLLEGLRAAGLPDDAIQRVPTRERSAVSQMLTMTDFIDVIVPRGGKGLVGLVRREARVPVFAHLEGIVHIYLDRSANPRKAVDVVLNSKTRRTGICGAAECLLIHGGIMNSLGRTVVASLVEAGVTVHGDAAFQEFEGVVPATPSDWGREYLSMDIAAKKVDSLDDAISHIRKYGSGHTDCIITEDSAAADRFFERLDSAILMRNSSTQFADGGEFGMGAEIGISTGKLHARGPVGAVQLTSFKYLVTGDGAVRS